MSAFPLADCKEKVVYQGRTIDKVMRAMVIEAEERLGYPLTIVQGSFNRGGVSQSAGTHDLGGVIDLAAYDHERKIEIFADLGGFPYHRPYLPGHWGEHIHVGVRDHQYMAGTAVRQQIDWDSTPPRDGLAGHNTLTGQYHPGRQIHFRYDPKTEKMFMPMNRVQKARHELVLAIHNIADAAALLDEIENRPVVAKRLRRLKRLHKKLRIELRGLPKR